MSVLIQLVNNIYCTCVILRGVVDKASDSKLRGCRFESGCRCYVKIFFFSSNFSKILKILTFATNWRVQEVEMSLQRLFCRLIPNFVKKVFLCCKIYWIYTGSSGFCCCWSLLWYMEPASWIGSEFIVFPVTCFHCSVVLRKCILQYSTQSNLATCTFWSILKL